MNILVEGAYATYPHYNGYWHGGVALVRESGRGFEVVGVGLDGADPVVLLELEDAGTPPWIDIAVESETLIVPWQNRLVVKELRGAGVARVAYTPPDGATMDGLVGVSADGRRAVTVLTAGEERTLVEIDLAAGTAESLARFEWWANHAHYCPADEQWIAFSHEGSASTVPDRVWAYHPVHAPKGVAVADQFAMSDEPGRPVAVGHERWMFHRPGALVVAYGESPVGPRGLWEVLPDGATRLVSAGDRDWHCGISRDGRWAVVDTSGPADAPGRGWQNADHQSSIVAIDTHTGERTVLATTTHENHPYHPHPSVTPDGRSVVFNHIGPTARGAAVVDLPASSSWT
ncbi:hypothetical protein ACFV9C_08415 [Kribbella sp. NPDC059898]|uniref:hypothetical protein n=1 Tax=Kribbella sp. NPDC059898 TaxID=3346995 RepID=UPI003656C7BA